MSVVQATSQDEKHIRTVAAIGSILLHLILLVLLSYIILFRPTPPQTVELDWGSSSGAPNQSIVQSENQPETQRESSAQPSGSPAEAKVDLPEMKSAPEATIPVAKKTIPKATVAKKPSKAVAENPSPVTRRRRAEAGPAGGAGKSTGYSIEWAGVGSRKLLSGRIPIYPDGTDKEMPVVLRFSVLPDGSVSTIIPVRRSDEILEREAISALRTWRFDALPSQFEQVAQSGIITFNFKLE
jgi:TonB family protein